jgi:hypothetical protein
MPEPTDPVINLLGLVSSAAFRVHAYIENLAEELCAEPELREMPQRICDAVGAALERLEAGEPHSFELPDDEALCALLILELSEVEFPDDPKREARANGIKAFREALDRHVIDGPTLRALEYDARIGREMRHVFEVPESPERRAYIEGEGQQSEVFIHPSRRGGNNR